MTAYERRVETHNSQLTNIKKTLAHRRLNEFLGEDAAKLLAFLERAYDAQLKVKPQFESDFRRAIPIPADRVESATGITTDRQRRAFAVLEYVGVARAVWMTYPGDKRARFAYYEPDAYARLLKALDQFDAVMKAPYRLFDFPSDR